MATEPLVVEALYSFKGSNNDELCFKKGDIITVTQKDEGWWEGTLKGKTGWFPSNYVKECKDVPKLIVPQENQYKNLVLKDLIDSEKAYITELEGLVTNFLQPLEKGVVLNPDEYIQLTSNITEILDIHQQLLMLVEQESAKPGLEQRVGNLFLSWATKIKTAHQTYCSLHPRAVCILDKYRDDLTKYMESRGAASPGVLVLTTMLSKPFRRLDKYSGMLQELERHVEECHPDRGDTQRSVSVYKDIAMTCSTIRRQKELELQVLTGPVRGWEGPSLTTLGEIIYMGSVAVGSQHHDRYFVLFPTTLVILSVSQRLSAFIYEGKLFLSGLIVTRLEDTEQLKNTFEISAPMIDKRVVVCQSKQEADRWVELLTRQVPRNSSTSNHMVSPSQAQYVPQPPPHMSPLVSGANVHNSHPPNPVTVLPPAGGGRTASSTSINLRCSSPPAAPLHGNGRGWSATCLRPTPPLRPCLALGAIPGGPYQRYSRRMSNYKEDGIILDVIEAYCSLGKPRSTINSVSLIDNSKSELVKAIPEAVGLLQSKLNVLEYKLTAFAAQIKEERDARCALQQIVRNYMVTNTKDFESIQWPPIESDI